LPKHSAGTEVYTQRLCEALRDRHEVQLFHSEKIQSLQNYSLQRRRTLGDAVEVVVNNLLYRNFEETYANAAIEERFDRVLDQFQPDVVHVQHLLYLSLGLVRKARERGIPSVMTLHDFWLFCPRMGQLLEDGVSLCTGPEDHKCSRCLQGFSYRQSPWQARAISAMTLLRRVSRVNLAPLVEWSRGRSLSHARSVAPAPPPSGVPVGKDPTAAQLEQRRRRVTEFLSEVDHFVTPSMTVLQRSCQFGLPQEKIECLPNGIPQAPPLPKVSRPLGEGLVVGFLGTLVPHKGAAVLVEAFGRAQLPCSRLLLVGGAQGQSVYRRQLMEMARGLEVEFVGRIRNERVYDWLGRFDLLVIPSLWLENAPVVVQEARQAGVPLIASRLGGLEEAVRDGVDGLLFEVGDAEDLAAKLRQVAADPACLDRFAKAAPAPMPMEKHVQRLELIYASLQGAER
jgi:glycosyltransferase involved in cell wall biosynthesis